VKLPDTSSQIKQGLEAGRPGEGRHAPQLLEQQRQGALDSSREVGTRPRFLVATVFGEGS
jgi:hypothetical protein